MIYCKNNKAEIHFDEEKGVIKSLSYGGREYVFADISIFEISKLNKDGDRIKLDVNAFKPDTVKSDIEGFVCIYKNAERRV